MMTPVIPLCLGAAFAAAQETPGTSRGRAFVDDRIGFTARASAHDQERAARDLNLISSDKRTKVADGLQQQLELLVREKKALRSERSRNGPVGTIDVKLRQVDNAAATVSKALDVIQGTTTAPPSQLVQVDEVIRWFNRPIWLVCNGQPWLPERSMMCNGNGDGHGIPADFGPIVKPKLELLRQATHATGLITSYDKTTQGLKVRGQLATAVVVSDKHVLTNRHVIEEGGIGFYNEGAKRWDIYDGIAVKIEFPYEYTGCSASVATKEVEVHKVVYADPELDVAILETDPSLPPKVEFDSKDDTQDGDRVVVVGYPSRPADGSTFLSPLQIDCVFSAPNGRTPFPAERMAAGMVFREQTVPAGYFAHDASTWGGNSGSLVIDLATGKYAGLHARGLESRTEGVGYNEAVLASRIVAILKAASVTH